MNTVAALPWIKRIGVVSIVVVALVHLGFRIQLISDHRVDIGGAEINVVYGIQKILLGRPLYEDPEQPPFDVMQYTPAYYGLCAGIGAFLRIDPHDTYALFLLSRIVSLVLNLLTCLLVFRLCRSLGSDAWLSVAAAAMAFALFTEHFYSRGDSLYALLFTATLTLFARWGKQKGRPKQLAIVALLAVLCLFSKQTGILIIATIGAHLLLSKQWHAFLTFSGAAMLFVATFLLLILKDTAPGIFFANTVHGVANGTGATMYHELFDQGTYKYYLGFHVAVVVLVPLFFRSRDLLDRFLAVAIACAFVFGLITGLKNASNLNYLFEAHLLVVVGVVRWCARATRWQVPCVGLLLLYGLLFTLHRTRVLHKRVGTEEYRASMESAYRADLHARDVLRNELGLRPEDKVFITYRGHLELLLNGQGLLAQKDVIEWSVHPLFNYGAFYRMMDGGGVRYVISDAEPTDTLRFMFREWEPTTTVREVDGRWVSTMPGATE